MGSKENSNGTLRGILSWRLVDPWPIGPLKYEKGSHLMLPSNFHVSTGFQELWSCVFFLAQFWSLAWSLFLMWLSLERRFIGNCFGSGFITICCCIITLLVFLQLWWVLQNWGKFCHVNQLRHWNSASPNSNLSVCLNWQCFHLLLNIILDKEL